MRCNNCGKTIPEVSTVCPYCNLTVDPNAKPPMNFGDINDMNYDSNKFDIKVYVKEPKNRKVVLLAIVTIVFVLVVFIALVLSVFTKKDVKEYQVYNNIIDTVQEYLDDNYLISRTAFNGDYKLKLKINDESNEFNGSYAVDIKNKILKLDSTMKDPKEDTGEIVVNSKDFTFETYLKDNNLYFKSDEIFGDLIYFPIEDETGLLKTKQYDLYSLVTGITDATKETLKTMTFNKTKETIVYRGTNTTTNKISLVLDNAGKREFLSSFFQYLIEDSNFVNEYARLLDKNGTEATKILENYKTTAEYKYSGTSDDYLEVDVYYYGSKVYRIEINNNFDNNKKTYRLDIGDTKYYFDYFLNDKNINSATLVKVVEEIENQYIKKYTITFDSDKYVSDIYLELEEDKQANIKKQEITNYKNIQELTVDEINNIKQNVSYYIDSYNELVDKIVERFKEKCSPNLQCVCNEGEDTCQCTYNDTIIKCDVSKVKVTNETQQ